MRIVRGRNQSNHRRVQMQRLAERPRRERRKPARFANRAGA
nr:MAG TPA: hypothetical protein [Caudoviricetes sp.]